MFITHVFQNGNDQTLQIPQEIKTDAKEFYISKIEDIYIAYPIDDPWASLRHVIGTFPEDFTEDREQSSWASVSQREEL